MVCLFIVNGTTFFSRSATYPPVDIDSHSNTIQGSRYPRLIQCTCVVVLKSFELGTGSLDSILACGEIFMTREGGIYYFNIATAAIYKHRLSD